MIALVFGGVNEIPGIGCGIATIMMSRTPFWLLNTGGSTSVLAPAVAVPAHETATTAAAENHWRIETSRALYLLNTGPSLGGVVCLYGYWLMAMTAARNDCAESGNVA
jgi:hypothetical protein